MHQRTQLILLIAVILGAIPLGLMLHTCVSVPDPSRGGDRRVFDLLSGVVQTPDGMIPTPALAEQPRLEDVPSSLEQAFAQADRAALEARLGPPDLEKAGAEGRSYLAWWSLVTAYDRRDDRAKPAHLIVHMAASGTAAARVQQIRWIGGGGNALAATELGDPGTAATD